MRCIEMMGWLASQADMLAINRNMRCIEIRHRRYSIPQGVEINRNMRCIEIADLEPSGSDLLRLIET